MKYIVLIILLFSFSASNGQKALETVKLRSRGSVAPGAKPVIPFFENYFYSYNATASDVYGDTTFALAIDTFLKAIQDNPEHEHGTTIGDRNTYHLALLKLDTLITVSYKKIYKKLKNPRDKELFKRSQDNWKLYFASEMTFLDQVYHVNGPNYGLGREHAITQVQWAFQVARQRLILLKNMGDQLADKDE
ncbi:hypothetical protein DBR32_03945 [Taibaiella sp. KBW10]|uniref:hypothetical protein n=1 Tax=Taibaiella sp. KBW10 TaxID=2153357 RepID=UPI000F5B4025|nr:hypothetical protein [Taibaiella sp. KBW10]RQO31964.1 hypothetical protein DBR32_03945 [Taibaiella sp. KBW10]